VVAADLASLGYRGGLKVEIPKRGAEDMVLCFIYAGASVWRTITIAAISILMFASFEHPAAGASIGGGNPYPVSNYTCQDGTFGGAPPR
jgi:hypothetical protein